MGTQPVALQAGDFEMEEPAQPQAPVSLHQGDFEIDTDAPAPSRPAGLLAGVDLPQPAAHAPAPDMRTPSFLDSLPSGINRAFSAPSSVQGKDVPAATAAAGRQLLHGPATFARGVGEVFDPREGGTSATRTGVRTGDPNVHNDQLHALAEVVSGAGETALTAGAPEMANTGLTAVAGGEGAAAARFALAKMITGFAAGKVSEKVADQATQKLGFSSSARELVDALAFFVPSVAGEAAGLQTTAGTTDGKTGAGATAFGGRASAGAYVSPEEYAAGVRVGDTQVQVRVPRNPAAPQEPTDTSQIAANSHASNVEHTMMQAAVLDHATNNVINGKPPLTPAPGAPTPPPAPAAPPMPKGMQKGVLSQAVVSDMAKAVQLLPEEQRGTALQEAHANLSKWIAQQGQFTGPDGKLMKADNPDAAAKLAQDIINGEVDRQTKAAESTAKEQQKATEANQQQASEAQERVYQRAKTILESNAVDGRDPVSLLQRNLRLQYGQARDLVQRFSSEGGTYGSNGYGKAAPVGEGAHQTTEESRATVDAQLAALTRGDIKVVMIPAGSRYIPQVPDGMKMMSVKEGQPGSGLYVYDPSKIRAATIKEAAKAGTHGDLLGHIQTKEDLADGQPTAVVQAVDPDTGVPIQDSQVHATPEMVQAQSEVMQERHPNADIVVKSPEQVVAERHEAAANEPTMLADGDFEVEPNTTEKEVRGTTPEQPQGEASTAPTRETKYEYGSTQHDIAPESEAARSLQVLRDSIPDEDLAGKGRDIDADHVTVRYGIQGDDTSGIRDYLKKQAPFEAKLGKVTSFPPSKNSDGAAVLKADVESPELHRLNAEIERHGDFKESDFPDYKPHATIAYVKPEAIDKYTGTGETEGKTFTVDHVAISDRDGNKEVVKLEGNSTSATSSDVKKQEAERIEGRDGRETNVLLPSGEKLRSRYRLVDLDSLIPSHDAQTFAPNASYPEGVQERQYHQDKNAQDRVIKQGQNFNPDYVINSNPDAVNGPPVITPDGIVLGGNSRTMSLARAYEDETLGNEYRRRLAASAGDFGLTSQDVEGMEHPVLVREVDSPADAAEMRRIGSELNKSMTGALTDTEAAVSAGKNISDATMQRIAEMLEAESGPDDPATLRRIMSKEQYGRELVRAFQRDGVFTDRERSQFQSADGTLNDKGKLFVEQAVLGHLVDDPQTMASVPSSVLDKLGSSIGSIASFATREDAWNIIDAIRGALAEHAEAASRNLALQDMMRNRDMFAPERNPMVDAIALKLVEPTAQVREAFRQFAQDSLQDIPGQMRLLGNAPDPEESFNAAFGAHLSKQEFEAAEAEAKTHVKKRETKRAPRETKRNNPETESAITKPAKGDWVRFYDRSNIEHAGRVTFANDRIASVRADGRSWTVKHKDIIGPAEPQQESADSLQQALEKKIAAGDMPKDNNALRKLASEMSGKPVDNLGLKAAQEALEVAIVNRARDVVAAGGDTRGTFDELVKLYESQPLLNMRTSTSMTNQAYSTPAPLAYLADLMAGVGQDAKVYEPTAGNGMLLIAASPDNAHANELNVERAAALKQQGFTVTEDDAARTLPVSAKSMDAVVANPPFGSVKGNEGKPVKVDVDGYKVGKIDHLIAARALDAMKDDGRAVLILGADKIAGGVSSDDRVFFNWLYSHYNVTNHFELDGKMYDRQGAGWPVRVISIAGRESSSKVSPLPGTIERVGTWPDVYERSTANSSVGTDSGRGAEAGPVSAGAADGDEPRDVRASAGTALERPDHGESRPRQAATAGDSGREPRPVRSGDADTNQPTRPGPDDVRPDADVAESDRLPQRARSGDGKPSNSGRPGSKSALADADNAFQVKYTPASSKKDEGVLIPTNMRDALQQAMARLEDEVGDIDKFVQKELGYDSIDALHEAFMGLQVDSVAAAIHQIQQGKAVIIGDQTGIGKGRQAAAILRWALMHDRIPVFLTVKDQLFTDMYNDLADIGTHDLVPFIINADASVTAQNGQKIFRNSSPAKHRSALQEIAELGNLPNGRNGLFLTYSQISGTDKSALLKRAALDRIIPKAVIVLDESHNAGGASQTGEYVQELLKSAGGVAYLSATYAKRPDNMPVYHKTDIGMAVADKDALEEAMKQGGLPLQTVVSNNLVKAGQFFRRERSYDGVEINQHVTTSRRKQHVQISDRATEALRGIVEADRMFHDVYVPRRAKEELAFGGHAYGGAGNRASQMVQHTEFSAVVHNFVKQMLLGMMVDPTVEQAIAAHKRGQKPVIALENTMGSFLSDYVATEGLQQGDSLAGLDYRTVLQRALERTRAIMVTTPGGEKVRREVQLHELDEDTRKKYKEAAKIIDGLDVDLPISPVDAIRDKLTKAGLKIAEITGRDLAVDYSKDGLPVLSQVPAEEQKDKVLTTRKFNDGRLDAIVLNVSGSTGISLHASERFKDQNQRHMIVAQPASDINIFMQMLGRIHRTGQVRLPGYTLMAADLPAQKRPTALLSKKMKSLNANTSSNTESATSIQTPDMLNKYGDAIVSQYLKDNPHYAIALDLVGSDDEEGRQDIARKATGRLALLPVAEQEAFYNDVEQQYNALIKYLDDTNQNDLEPKTFDFDAKPVKDQVLVDATNPSSPFGEAAVYGVYDIKRQSKPITPSEVTEALKESLGEVGGGTKTQTIRRAHATNKANELIASLDKQYEAFAKELEPGSPRKNQEAQVADTARAFIKSHPIGSAWRIEINGETYNAAVLDVISQHRGTGNPYAMSKVVLHIATTGPRYLSLPATQFERIVGASLGSDIRAEALFDNADTLSQRERAQIVTGNLLAAYGELENSGGRIINFSKADGTVEQGILLPKKFDVKKDTRQDVRVPDPADVAAIVKASTADTAKDFGLRSRDGNVGIVKDTSSPSGLAITTPRAKAKGGMYFLNKDLTDIVGDFVSQGGYMRAKIPAGKEVAAVSEIQKKAALYAPPSMANDARAHLQKKGGSQTTLHASAFGLDLLAKFMAKSGKALYERDVAPAMRAVADTAPAIGKQIANTLYPRAFANKDALDSIMKALGERQMMSFKLDHLDGGLADFFDKMTPEENIAFLDRRRLGVGQPSPELQRIDDMIKSLNDEMLKRVQQYKPSLQAKENYQGAIWKVVPGSKTNGSNLRGSGKRPFQGHKGFTKQQTLETITEGLNMGGELASNNAWTLNKLILMEQMRYVSAQDYWRDLKDLGLRKFVKLGERPPEEWMQVPDGIAQVYFPASSGEGLVDAGKWYVEPSAGRLLVNFLSKDKIRSSAIGSSLMAMKNVATAFTLGASPYHALNVSLRASASQLGLGMSKFWNQGMRYGDAGKMWSAAKDVAQFMAAPVQMARDGGKLINMTADFQKFIGTQAGTDFITRYPNAPELLKELFESGLTLSMNHDYDIEDRFTNLPEEWKAGNYIGSLARVMPWAGKWLMHPVMKVYIPRLKAGFALAQYAQSLADNAKELASGDVNRAEIARRAVDTAENRFGELNYDTMFLDNTVKAAMQLALTSPTWKVGEWRSAGSALTTEMVRSLQEPIRALYEDVRAGKKTHGAEEYVPKIQENQAYFLGAFVLMAMTAAAITYAFTRKYPWQFIEGDHKLTGNSYLNNVWTEFAHPRTGRYNPYTHKPERISLPLGFQDYEHAAGSPAEYAKSSLSEPVSRSIDLLRNRDFYGNYVHDPKASYFQQFIQGAEYALPTPIVAESLFDKHGAQDAGTKTMKGIGLRPSTNTNGDFSRAERAMRDAGYDKHEPLTHHQVEEQEKNREAAQSHPTPAQIKRAIREGQRSHVENMFNRLSYSEARDIFYNEATDRERTILRPMFEAKRARAMKR